MKKIYQKPMTGVTSMEVYHFIATSNSLKISNDSVDSGLAKEDAGLWDE